MSDEFRAWQVPRRISGAGPGLLDEKSKGQEITIAAPEAPWHGQIIDLMKALKESIEKAKPKQKAAAARRKRKTAS
jgi:non-homologous end joining protein Ku